MADVDTINGCGKPDMTDSHISGVKTSVVNSTNVLPW